MDTEDNGDDSSLGLSCVGSLPPPVTRRDGESDAVFSRRRLCFRRAVDAVGIPSTLFIVDIAARVGINRSTFSQYFPVGSREREWIDSRIMDKRRRVVSSVYAKLYKSDNPQALITLLRALATPEERAAITPSTQSGVAIATSGTTLIATQSERDARLRDWFADYAAKTGIKDGKPRSAPVICEGGSNEGTEQK